MRSACCASPGWLIMLWKESLESSLALLEKEEYVVEVSLRKKPFNFKVLEDRTSEWAARLQTLLDTLISFQTHILPGSAVIERDGYYGESDISEEEKRHPNFLVPHLLGSLEKGMALLRLTVESKLETQFLIRKQFKDESDGMRSELEKARQLQIQNEEVRLERHQLRDELKQLKSLYDTQRNELLLQVNNAHTERAKYKTQAEECERLVRGCEKEISLLRTRVVQLESERDSARACVLDARAQLMKEEEAHSRALGELKTCKQKLTVAETQREALLFAKLQDATPKPMLCLPPTITSPTPETTPTTSPSRLIPVTSHQSPVLSYTSPLPSNGSSTFFHYLPAPYAATSHAPINASPPTKYDQNNPHAANLLHNDALHKGSLRSTGSLHTEISLAAEEKVGDVGLTERLLHARLASLGLP